MKRCNLCNAVYDNSYHTCPTCGAQLTPFSESSNVQTNENTGGTATPRNWVAQHRNRPGDAFSRQEGFDVVFNGAIAEANTQQFYQSKLTKILRAVFSSEPYQLSHTSNITVFRVEEHTMDRYPEQARDIVLFGGMQNVLAPGDDVTVRAKRRGNRYIAKSVYNHSTNSWVRIEANIPAGVIQVLFWVAVFAVFGMIYSLATINYAAVGQSIAQFFTSLIPMALMIGLLWHTVKSFFKK